MGNHKRFMGMRVCVIFALLLALISIYLSSTLATEEDSSLKVWGSSRVERSAKVDAREKRQKRRREKSGKKAREMKKAKKEGKKKAKGTKKLRNGSNEKLEKIKNKIGKRGK